VRKERTILKIQKGVLQITSKDVNAARLFRYMSALFSVILCKLCKIIICKSTVEEHELIHCGRQTQGDDQVLHSSKLAPDEGCMETALRILCMFV